MTASTTKNRKIVDFIYNFGGIAKKEKWTPKYDKDTDSLAFIAPNLSDDTRISYIDDEIALYFDENKEIRGIFIEYFTSNFVKHHKELNKVTQDIKKRTRDNKSLIDVQTIKNKKVFSMFEEVVKTSLLENVQFQQPR